MPMISIILPARNEAAALKTLLPELRQACPDAEVVVVNDASTDETAQVAAAHGARVVAHRYPMGNGAAVKTGARAASGDVLVFMDADGQHDPADIPRLVETLSTGFDMVVGARSSRSQAGIGRLAANGFYNWFASRLVGQRIADLTSGMRAVDARKFRSFLHLLPNGFSYPTSITMAFFRAGYGVGYVPIHARTRVGKSHIRPLRDGIRFLLIIFKIGTLYSPLRIFVPISASFFGLGAGYYLYTFLAFSRFTNMSALLLTTSVIVFLIGLISEQITTLLYSQRPDGG
jgi:glycosyltransferase involved in cell wall biosynthesis